MSHLTQRFLSEGPKRILALDGGGIRGIIALEFLQKIEDILRQRYNDPEFKLSQYFDLIGGTSTGSIIGTCLSLGMSVSEIKALYLKLGESIFGEKQSLLSRYTGATFTKSAIQKSLYDSFGDLTLGSENVRTGLCIVAKRADTGSTWPLINHPDSLYYEQNKGILLRQAVRASTAAPTFFAPEKIEVGRSEEGVFIDGGVSMYNNPAMLLFLIATLKGYAYKWPTGSDNILIVSLGTGSNFIRNSISKIMRNRIWNWGKQVPELLMRDASIQNHLLLQYMSDSPTRTAIDNEIGDMRGDLLGKEKLLSYLRYSVNIELNELNSLGFTDAEVSSLMKMSEASNVHKLSQIGQKAADIKILANHFSSNFDVK